MFSARASTTCNVVANARDCKVGGHARIEKHSARHVRMRQGEVEYFREMGVYEKVNIDECLTKTSKAPIAARWVDINKGDDSHPNYRSRLVAKEFRTDLRPELYAASRPSECLRMPISKMASKEGMRMMYADVSRAYFYALAVRPVYVELPKDDKKPGDQNRSGTLVGSMYGTRDAAVNWSDEYTETLAKDGYKQGRANPCFFWHPSTKGAVMVHGDDFVAVGSDESLKSTRRTLEEKYKIKVQVLGPDEEQQNQSAQHNHQVDTGGYRARSRPTACRNCNQRVGLGRQQGDRGARS